MDKQKCISLSAFLYLNGCGFMKIFRYVYYSPHKVKLLLCSTYQMDRPLLSHILGPAQNRSAGLSDYFYDWVSYCLLYMSYLYIETGYTDCLDFILVSFLKCSERHKNDIGFNGAIFRM